MNVILDYANKMDLICLSWQRMITTLLTLQKSDLLMLVEMKLEINESAFLRLLLAVVVFLFIESILWLCDIILW